MDQMKSIRHQKFRCVNSHFDVLFYYYYIIFIIVYLSLSISLYLSLTLLSICEFFLLDWCIESDRGGIIGQGEESRCRGK